MFLSWCRKLLGSSTSQNRRIRRATRRTLSLEHLEAREVPAFLTPVSYSTGANPAGIAVADYNGDGRDDMAVVSQGLTGSVGIMLSNVDVGFQPRVDYAAGSSAVDAAAGDFNGDGKMDLVVVGTGVNILLGNGDGTFAAPVTYASGTAAHTVKVGDFNNDGKLDIGTMTGNSASVLMGNGDGTFAAPNVTTVIGNNINLVVGDYNRDGNLDMATSNTTSVGTVSILKGRGDGTFNAAESYAAFSAPVYLATGDFNNDGYLDFAVPNSYSATSMSVLLNNGDGTYAAPHTYGIAQTGYEIEVADFNNDGNADYAVRGGSLYMVHLGKGDGTFYAEQTFSTPSGRFESGTHGDFNGDGAVDFAYSTGTGVTVVTNDNADYQNLAGAVTFRVNAPSTTTSGSVLPMTVSAVDANGNVVSAFRGVVYLTSSDPLASTATGYAFNPLDAGIPYVFTAADAGSHTFAGALRLVSGGDQTVTVSAPNMTAASATVNVTGQVNRLAFTAPTSANAGDTFSIAVSATTVEGTIATGYSSRVHFTSSDVLAGLPADYTFTAADAGMHTFTVTLKASGSRFISATEVGGTITGGASVNVAAGVAQSFTLAGAGGAIGVARPITIVARDVYGNTDTNYSGLLHFTSTDPLAILPPDTALVNGVATVNVTLLTVGTQQITATGVANAALTGTISSDATPPVPASFAVTGFPATVAGVSHTFTVSVRDTIGQIASGFTGTVYFSSTDVQAGLPASYTFTAADAGVHVFAATFKTAGIQSISVRDTSGLLNGLQAGITVTSAAFSGFKLSVPNGADSKGHILVAAGDSISLTVKAVDAFGNAVVGYTGKVKFSSTDIQAGLPKDYSFTAADAGVHTFTVVLKTATPNGVVWSFGVVDASNATTLVTLTNFEVTNGAAAKFVIATPSNITAGAPFSLKVTVLDAYGNTVKNHFGTIHFGNTAGSLGLPADYTFSNTDNGVHSFTVTLNTVGTQSISITDIATPSLASTAVVTVKAAATGGGGGGGGGKKP